MNTSCTAQTTNQLLAALPPESADSLQSRLDAVVLATGAMLYEAGTVLRHVYLSPLAAGPESAAWVLPSRDSATERCVRQRTDDAGTSLQHSMRRTLRMLRFLGHSSVINWRKP